MVFFDAAGTFLYLRRLKRQIPKTEVHPTMKRFLTLLLAVAMGLSFAACGDNGTTIRNENEEDNVKKDPIAAQYLQDLAVKTADYPVLPAMPSTRASWTRPSAPSTMTRWARTPTKRRRRRSGRTGTRAATTYYDALKRAAAARARAYPDGIPGLHTGDAAAELLFGGGEHRHLARKPVSRASRCSARRRTATAARSFCRF